MGLAGVEKWLGKGSLGRHHFNWACGICVTGIQNRRTKGQSLELKVNTDVLPLRASALFSILDSGNTDPQAPVEMDDVPMILAEHFRRLPIPSECHRNWRPGASRSPCPSGRREPASCNDGMESPKISTFGSDLSIRSVSGVQRCRRRQQQRGEKCDGVYQGNVHERTLRIDQGGTKLVYTSIVRISHAVVHLATLDLVCVGSSVECPSLCSLVGCPGASSCGSDDRCFTESVSALEAQYDGRHISNFFRGDWACTLPKLFALLTC